MPSGLWLVHLRRHHGIGETQAREQALAVAIDELEATRREQAVLQERHRIMRELHDGLGAQLVGLQTLLERGDTSPQALAAALAEAQDELRLAVDSVHVGEGGQYA